MKHILTKGPATVATLSPSQLRDDFLLSGLFKSGSVELVWWETDRAVVAGVSPAEKPLVLEVPDGLRSTHFFERREAGVINIGGAGAICVDGEEHHLAPRDGLYVGRGAKEVEFVSDDPQSPAQFWLQSYPAHADYPTRRVAAESIEGVKLGSSVTGNERENFKYFHPDAFPTCQIVMGLTTLSPGSVWNTMPPHTHLRRSEVYLYFDLLKDEAVIHLMGRPKETRHLVVRDRQAVVSPPWSIHCGAGTTNYSFIWGMGGENQDFNDMDSVSVSDLS